MALNYLKNIICICVVLVPLYSYSVDKDVLKEKEIQVSLRMIGHKMLLSVQDSTSVVRPIVEENGKYRIEFGAEFKLSTDELVQTVEQAFKEMNIAEDYFVEVEDCATNEIVYSFKIEQSNKSSVIPCINRDQPKSCYNLLFTVFSQEVLSDNGETKIISSNDYLLAIIALLLFGLILFFIYRRKSKQVKNYNPDLVSIGRYVLNIRTAELLIDNSKTELSTKETELLLLLASQANKVVEREEILRNVWGDQGDYVGRTLDVFISKLRKKLEKDSDVKIVNSRGIGYKLVV